MMVLETGVFEIFIGVFFLGITNHFVLEGVGGGLGRRRGEWVSTLMMGRLWGC